MIGESYQGALPLDPRSHPPKNLACNSLDSNDLKILQNDWTAEVHQYQMGNRYFGPKMYLGSNKLG